MSVLSDVQLIEGLINDHVVCRPLRPENIRGSSIDLTLGEWFWRCKPQRRGVLNPYDEAEVERYFAGPFQAKPYADVYDKIGWREPGWPVPVGREIWAEGEGKDPGRYAPSTSPFPGIPDDWPVIVLRPRERILAHTHEFFGARSPGTSEIRARSSTGRWGETVCLCAGWGDPSFQNRWVMEMMNLNDQAIIVPLGERVAQGIIHETGPTREEYGSERRYESKYQHSADIEEIIANWTPQQMLPRNWKDSRQPTLPLDAESYEQALKVLCLDVVDRADREIARWKS